MRRGVSSCDDGQDLSCLLFLHIPKTAGTSFRLGAVQLLGAERCQLDYGRRSPDTTELVRNHVYEDPDLFRFGVELERAGSRILSGHFDRRKYGALFRSTRILSFCRDPRQQLMSHYAHFVRVNGYAGTLEEFLASDDGGGRQTRAFGSAPLEVFGFIGVTERYQESLRVIRKTFGLDIEPMVQNTNPDRHDSGEYKIPEEVAGAYAAAVEKDSAIYARANHLLDQRLAALDAGYTFVHGAIQASNHSAIRGFAFDGSPQPVVVELTINGKRVASCKAVGDRPGLGALGTPRKGYIGFDFHKHNLLKTGDEAVVTVASSGQVLGRHVMERTQENVRR